MKIIINKKEIAKAVLDHFVAKGELEGGVEYWCSFETTTEPRTGGLQLVIEKQKKD